LQIRRQKSWIDGDIQRSAPLASIKGARLTRVLPISDKYHSVEPFNTANYDRFKTELILNLQDDIPAHLPKNSHSAFSVAVTLKPL
jgi:hypothetical protein